jgi:hypothetical protein
MVDTPNILFDTPNIFFDTSLRDRAMGKRARCKINKIGRGGAQQAQYQCRSYFSFSSLGGIKALGCGNRYGKKK